MMSKPLSQLRREQFRVPEAGPEGGEEFDLGVVDGGALAVDDFVDEGEVGFEGVEVGEEGFGVEDEGGDAV